MTPIKRIITVLLPLALFMLIHKCGAASFTDVSIWNISWVLSLPFETQADACIRNHYNPFVTDNYELNWNSNTLNTVIVEILNRTVSTAANNSYGIVGCCAPGLWCDDSGCFTQSYSSRFVNYGWLNNQTSAVPVYTCIDSDNSTISLKGAALDEQSLTLWGDGFSSDEDTTFPYLGSEVCDNVEICNCAPCTHTSECVVGQQCLRFEDVDESSYCFLTCAGTGDNSCPCDTVCKRVSGTGSSSISLCLPSDEEGFIANCANTTGQLTCDVPRAYQNQNITDSGGYYNVSLIMDDRAGRSLVGDNALISGFCAKNSDCEDGNVCTVDTCDSITGYCSYSTLNGCNSIPKVTREREAPYVYYNYYISDLYTSQQSSVSTIVELGLKSSVSDGDAATHALESIQLPFWIEFFGNLVNTAYISLDGIIALPPVRTCDSDQCNLFATSSNLISPWFSWIPEQFPLLGNAGVFTYTQRENSTSIFGVDGVNAFHVLYNNTQRTNATPSTFAASIYEDGSIKISFVTVPSSRNNTDFSGLWGAFASEQDTYRRYHLENISSSLIVSGSEIDYCPVTAFGCPVETCVSHGDIFQVNWNGTSACNALGNDIALVWSCSWVGGLAVTPAILSNDKSQLVSCSVPELGFSNGEVVTVDLVVSTVNATDPNVTFDFNQNFGYAPDAKKIFGATEGTTGELSRVPFMVRYYSGTNKPINECGCSALPAFEGLSCDSLNVCGGNDTQSNADCFGTAFGSAINAGCSTCSGGLTKITPVFSCTTSSDDGSSSSIVGQTIILLMIICCMTFIAMSLSYSIRRMLAIRALNESIIMAEAEMLAFEMGGVGGAGGGGQNQTQNRGMTEFECDALGEVVFTREFYAKHEKEKLLNSTSYLPLLQDGNIEEAYTSAKAKPSSEGCDCPICLMDIEEGSTCRVLPEPCSHVFHKTCIDQWFKQATSCPLCKRSIRAILEGTDEEQQVNNAVGRGSTAATEHHQIISIPMPPPPMERDYSGNGMGTMDFRDDELVDGHAMRHARGARHQRHDNNSRVRNSPHRHRNQRNNNDTGGGHYFQQPQYEHRNEQGDHMPRASTGYRPGDRGTAFTQAPTDSRHDEVALDEATLYNI